MRGFPAWCGVLFACASAQAEIDSTAGGRWKMSLGLESRSLPVDIYRTSGEAELSFASNNSPDLRVGLQYKEFGGSVAYALGKMKDDVDVQTEYLDVQLLHRSAVYGVDVLWQRFEGYYLRPASGPVRVLHPDMRVSTQVLNVYRKLWGGGDLYSIDQLLPTTRGFSAVVYGVAGLSHRSTSSPLSLIPDSSARSYPELVDLREIDVLSPHLSLGMGLPMRAWRLFLLPSLRLGFGVPISLSEDIDTQRESLDLAVRLILGYLGPTGSFSLVVSDDSDAFGMPGGATVQYHSIVIGLNLGINL